MKGITIQTFFRASRILIPLLVFGTGNCALRAQAMATATGPGSYIAIGGGASAFPSDYDRRNIAGGMVFVDIQPTFRYGFEGEARFLRYHTDETVDQTNYLVGVRAAFRPPRLRPYAKFLLGATKIRAPFGYAQGTFFSLVPGGGVDYLLNDRVTIRVADVEYQIVPQFIGNTVRNFGVSMGLSFRLNGVIRLPKGTVLRR